MVFVAVLNVVLVLVLKVVVVSLFVDRICDEYVVVVFLLVAVLLDSDVVL